MTEKEEILLDAVKTLTFALETVHNLGAPRLPPQAVVSIQQYVVYGKAMIKAFSDEE